jgi:hypothetical protein
MLSIHILQFRQQCIHFIPYNFHILQHVSAPTVHQQVLQLAKTVTCIEYRSYISGATAFFYINVAVTIQLTLVNSTYTESLSITINQNSIKIVKINLYFNLRNLYFNLRNFHFNRSSFIFYWFETSYAVRSQSEILHIPFYNKIYHTS